jgi:hypothetical protein
MQQYPHTHMHLHTEQTYTFAHALKLPRLTDLNVDETKSFCQQDGSTQPKENMCAPAVKAKETHEKQCPGCKRHQVLCEVLQFNSQLSHPSKHSQLTIQNKTELRSVIFPTVFKVRLSFSLRILRICPFAVSKETPHSPDFFQAQFKRNEAASSEQLFFHTIFWCLNKAPKMFIKCRSIVRSNKTYKRYNKTD